MFRRDRLSEYHAGPNALSAAREEWVRRGVPVFDLVSGRPDAHGLRFPEAALGEALEEARKEGATTTYEPDPMGRLAAREAIAAYYAEKGVSFAPEAIAVTPGTSFSYLLALASLAEPGDEVLVPRPSYPLFIEIARVSNVRLVPYRLRESDAWCIDLDELEDRVSTRTRIAVLISPHNPTGAVASTEEVVGLAEIARRHDLAIVSDEVFGELLFSGGTLARPAATGGAPLVLTLNGISKMFALPGWKIGWIALSGDEDRVAKAAWMLAHVADAFLPVNELAQLALPGIFARGRPFRETLLAHARAGRELALRKLSVSGASQIVPPEGGLFLTVRLLNEELNEEDLALDLLRSSRILVHPGSFYDIEPDHLVLSFASGESVLRKALPEIARHLTASREPRA
jgi:hypothetical protein